ncbi:acyltransferase [Vibrio breoganii]
MRFKKIFELLHSKVILLFYYLIYGKKLKMNFFDSFFQGELCLSDGYIIVGRKFRARKNVTINVTSGKLTIGDDVFMNRGVSLNLHDSISIGSNTMFGENICVYDHDHVFDEPNKLFKEQGFKTKPVVIGKNVWIGSGTIILAGSVIGDNSIIAAGSLVKGEVIKDSLFCQKRSADLVPLANKLSR